MNILWIFIFLNQLTGWWPRFPSLKSWANNAMVFAQPSEASSIVAQEEGKRKSLGPLPSSQPPLSGRSLIIFDNHDYPADEPYFDPITPTNVTTILNTSALLHCYVRQRNNKMVSWIRTRDLHLLTVGRYTFTTDLRFSAIHEEDTEDWMLLIERVIPSDSGIYECQISTSPLKNLAISLKVLEPETVIIGGPELHVGVGSTINLTCVVRNMVHPPANITWYKDDEIITFHSRRGGVSVLMEKGSRSTKSSLILLGAKLSDAANYTCSPYEGAPTSAIVHVIDGQLSAGWQHGNSAQGAILRVDEVFRTLTCVLVVGLFFRTLFLKSFVQAGGPAAQLVTRW